MNEFVVGRLCLASRYVEVATPTHIRTTMSYTETITRHAGLLLSYQIHQRTVVLVHNHRCSIETGIPRAIGALPSVCRVHMS